MKSPTLLLVASLVALVAGCAALTPAPPPEQDAELRLDRGLAAAEAGQYSEAFDDLAWVYSHCPGRRAGSQALVALAALDLDPRNPTARPAVGTELLGRVIRDPGTPDWLRPMAETAFLTGLGLGAPHPEGHTPPDPAPDPAPAADSIEPADTIQIADTVEVADTVVADTVEVRDTAEAVELIEHAEPEPDPPPAPTDAEGAAEPVVPDQPLRATEPVFGCGPVVPVGDRVAPSLPTLPGPSMATLLARSEAARDSAGTRAAALQNEVAAVREQLKATEAELERIRKTLKP